MDKPKNITEFIARSILRRIHNRDEELIKLRKDAIELAQIKKDNMCIMCKEIFGQYDDIVHCDHCGQICCSDCDIDHQYMIDVPEGTFCTPCVADKCQICHEGPRTYECNVCPQSMCQTCVIIKECPCGKSNIYCSQTCAALFIKPLKCWVCRRCCCSHNEHTWHYEERVVVCKDTLNCYSHH